MVQVGGVALRLGTPARSDGAGVARTTGAGGIGASYRREPRASRSPSQRAAQRAPCVTRLARLPPRKPLARCHLARVARSLATWIAYP